MLSNANFGRFKKISFVNAIVNACYEHFRIMIIKKKFFFSQNPENRNLGSRQEIVKLEQTFVCFVYG